MPRTILTARFVMCNIYIYVLIVYILLFYILLLIAQTAFLTIQIVLLDCLIACIYIYCIIVYIYIYIYIYNANNTI